MKRFATMFVFSFMALVCIAPSASAQSFSLGGPTDAGDYIQFDANADVSGDFSVTTSPAVNLYSDNAGTLVALAGNQPGLYPVDYSPLFLYLRKSEITSTITVTAVAPDGSVYSGSYTPPASSLTPTTTLLAITPASPAWGTQVTLTATVTSGSGTPTGDVKFFEGATQLGAAAPLNAGGVATFSSETFSLGSHTPITAVYVGNTSFETSTSPAGSFTVSPAVLIISGITAAPKVYDATVAASLDVAGVYLTGVVPGDDIHVNAAAATGTFPDKNVGTNRTVTIAGVSVTGTSLGNYTFSQPSTTATISAKPLTVTGVGASDKVYDGNAIAALTFASPTLVGAISGDDVTLNSAGVSGAFADKNVGPSKPVTITGLTLAGTDAGNYTLTQPSANASITPAPAVVTATAATKVYGTPDPALTGNLSGFVPADGITATFARTAGETVAGTYTISGTLNPAPALTNYAITYNSAAFTITKAPASVTPATASKVYGTPDPVFTGTLTGFLSADNVTATYSRTTGETVGSYVISAELSPAGILGNYDITYSTAPFTITTNMTSTLLASSANPSVYGEAVTFTATVSSAGGTPTGNVNFNEGATLLGTGTLNGSGVATFSTSSLSVTASPHAITATYVGDVNFAGSTSAAISQAITPKTLTVIDILANDKVYDGTTTATLNTGGAVLVGVVGTDDVVLNTSSATGTFATSAVGTGITVTISGLTITGTAAGNYTLIQPTTTANITPPPVERGLVTGIGLISPTAGSYPAQPSFAGKGYFVFLTSTLNGGSVPVGTTQFLLKSGGLFSKTAFLFSSSGYETMVLSGAKATFTGVGRINARGNFGFFVSTIDGRITGDGVDKFRIKIWDKDHANAVYFDSQIGAADDANPTSIVTGGVIAISKSTSTIAATPQMSIEQVVEEDEATTLPTAYTLYNAYPNPFNPATTIAFDLPEPSTVRLSVYDMLGREVAVLVNEVKTAGHHAVIFNASDLSSGTYVYRFQAGNFVQTKKLMLMK